MTAEAPNQPVNTTILMLVQIVLCASIVMPWRIAKLFCAFQHSIARLHDACRFRDAGSRACLVIARLSQCNKLSTIQARVVCLPQTLRGHRAIFRSCMSSLHVAVREHNLCRPEQHQAAHCSCVKITTTVGCFAVQLLAHMPHFVREYVEADPRLHSEQVGHAACRGQPARNSGRPWRAGSDMT